MPAHFFTLNATLDEIKTTDFDCLILPGGRSAEFLRLNE
jgi:protease I